MNEKVNYGNWVPRKMLHMSYTVIVFLIIVTAFSFSGMISAWNPLLVKGLQIICLLMTVFMICLSSYFTVCYHLFSYTGRYKIQERIVDYVVHQLELKKEDGTILDIGCGSGVVSIKTAKRYTKAKLISIDYWGKGWDYAKQQCERNAAIEGVKERITFQKGDAASLDFPEETFDGAISNFVFHEVATQPDKRKVVKEALRVIKPGGAFAFHDLFLDESLYGNLEELAEELRNEGVFRVEIIKTAELLEIPAILKNKVMIGNIALIYGVK
ncbi:MAG: class I SAM-dependent methyltransferase [Lachnospiraceae bacterium]